MINHFSRCFHYLYILIGLTSFCFKRCQSPMSDEFWHVGTWMFNNLDIFAQQANKSWSAHRDSVVGGREWTNITPSLNSAVRSVNYIFSPLCNPLTSALSPLSPTHHHGNQEAHILGLFLTDQRQRVVPHRHSDFCANVALQNVAAEPQRQMGTKSHRQHDSLWGGGGNNGTGLGFFLFCSI